MGLAVITTTTPAETAITDAFAAFFNSPCVETFCALTAATQPLIAARCSGTLTTAVPALSREREIPPVVSTLPAPWRPVTAPNAFDSDFEEIRVITDKLLRLEKLQTIGAAVGYAFSETVVGDALVLTGIEQQAEIVDGKITGEGKNVLTFAFDSTSSRRSEPDFAEAFATADKRIFEGSPVRTSDRQGAGSRGTKLVAGLGANYCKVEFFVR